MSRYAEYFSDALKTRVEVLNSRLAGALSLRDELVMMQEVCGQAIAAYGKICEKTGPDAAINVEDKIRLRGGAMDMLVHALNQVRDMTMAASRVENEGKGIDVAAMHMFVTQTSEILASEIEAVDGELRVVGHTPTGLVERVVERLRKELLVAAGNAVGTYLTPERLNAEVRAMHSSVPGPPSTGKELVA